MRETTGFTFFCNFEPPQMKRADLFSKRAPGQAFKSHVEAGEWVRENLPSASMLPVAFCHGWEREKLPCFHPQLLPANHTLRLQVILERIFQMCFFLGNWRQSYNLNKEYQQKNRRIFGFFQTGWGLGGGGESPPDYHFHCISVFSTGMVKYRKIFIPFFLEIFLNPVLDTAFKAKVLAQILNERPAFSCSPR